jgi:hypothetical protein
MPPASKPHAPISGLGRDGSGAAGAGAGAGAAGAVDAVSGAGAGVVVAAGLDPQPAVVARITANNRVFTWGSGGVGCPLTYQILDEFA